LEPSTHRADSGPARPGIFISFRIFGVADLTAEGSITLGAAIAAALIVAGVHPATATLLAFLGGFAAGALTEYPHQVQYQQPSGQYPGDDCAVFCESSHHGQEQRPADVRGYSDLLL
jgi:hypothetical protein